MAITIAVVAIITIRAVTSIVENPITDVIGETVSTIKMFAKNKAKAKTATNTQINKQTSSPTYLRAKTTNPGAEVYIDQPIDFQTAKQILDFGGDVYASNGADAELLCKAVGGGFSGPTNDGNPFNAMHYHPIAYAARGHVFYGQDSNLKFVTIFR